MMKNAEAAIRSPLLEDINLEGARGILVNITAGVDLNLGEFSEVGNIVEEFASDSATVVVGTVIDPEMTDELKVTVVATGLSSTMDKPIKVIDNTPKMADGTTDYNQLDRPAVSRRRPAMARAGNAALETSSTASQPSVDYLDIPAFLRRQAD